MSRELPERGAAYAGDLPISKWFRLAFLGSVKEVGSDNALIIARKYGKALNVLNALAPIFVAVLLFSGVLTPSYLSIAILTLLWVAANIVVLRRAPLERK